MARDVGDRARVAHVLHHIAALAHCRGEHEQAIRLMAASAKLREAAGGTPFTTLTSVTDLEREVAELHSQIDETDFAVFWALGQSMTFDQAIEYALAA